MSVDLYIYINLVGNRGRDVDRRAEADTGLVDMRGEPELDREEVLVVCTWGFGTQDM